MVLHGHIQPLDILHGNIAGLAGGAGGGLPPIFEAGDQPIITDFRSYAISSTETTDSMISITIPKAGEYKLCFFAVKGAQGTADVGISINGTPQALLSMSSRSTIVYYVRTLNEGDVVKICGKIAGTTEPVRVGTLTACIDWDIWDLPTEYEAAAGRSF